MTWSPFLSVVTPGPTSTTIPAPSWPKITGKSPSGSAPERVNSSVWHTPLARISINTSPALGPPRSTVTTSSGLPAAYAMAALVFMPIPRADGARCELGSLRACRANAITACQEAPLRSDNGGSRPSTARGVHDRDGVRTNLVRENPLSQGVRGRASAGVPRYQSPEPRPYAGDPEGGGRDAGCALG